MLETPPLVVSRGEIEQRATAVTMVLKHCLWIHNHSYICNFLF